jgi:hypothetical protein
VLLVAIISPKKLFVNPVFPILPWKIPLVLLKNRLKILDLRKRFNEKILRQVTYNTHISGRQVTK